METNTTPKDGLSIISAEALEMQTSENLATAVGCESENGWHEYFPDFSI